MRKACMMIALLGLTRGAAGEALTVESADYLGELHLAGGNWSGHHSSSFGPDVVWDNTGFNGFFVGATDRERLDWADVATGTMVNGFQIGYATNSTDPVDLLIAFYDGENGFNTPDVEVLTVIELLDLPGSVSGDFEGYVFDVDLEGGFEFTIDGADLDADGLSDWGYGYHVTNGGNGTSTGPLAADPGPEPVGAPGIEDAYDRYDPPGKHSGSAYIGTFDVTGLPFTQFHMRLYTVPEPGTVALLGMGVLAAVSRRRNG